MAFPETPRSAERSRSEDETRRNERPKDTVEKLEQLYGLIEGIEVAMMTTRAADGSLVSRPMATQKRIAGTDLWFMTNIETCKIDELERDPQINLSYYDNSSREFVSVSGCARVSRERARIHELYQPDWKVWLGDEGGERDGGPDDPRIALIFVEAQSASYLKARHSKFVSIFEIMKAAVTGERAELGEQEHLSQHELRKGPRPRAS